MTQQLVVEFLVDKILNGDWDSLSWPKRREIIEQAKQMEKEQLNMARLEGINLANKGLGKFLKSF